MKWSNLKKRIHYISAIFILFVLLGIMGLFFAKNYSYNHTKRTGKLIKENADGNSYNFGDIEVLLTVRSGENGAWLKDPIYDDDDNMIHGASVGTIYEVVINNKSKNIVSDWNLKIPINEMMWLNNSWDSAMEIHQNVLGDEKVLNMNLKYYGQFDITLDYYEDHTGPMIPLYEGDYFIYYPEEVAKEKPIEPKKSNVVGEGTTLFGYIMYIPDQTLDYVADFSGGEINYYMYEDPFSQIWFWALAIAIFVWVIIIFMMIVIKIKVKRITVLQEAQKAHDEEMVRQTMQLIINLIESKDLSTKGHSIRVAEYSKLLAEKMGFSEDESKNVYYIGLLHDCGKVNIPDAILKNPGKLSDEEYGIMKKHTIYGADVLKDFTSIKDIDIGAKYHHERYDGKGYPSGLAGEEIPFIARIIGVADALDAMSSNRCYRKKLPAEVIMQELKDNKGKQFDPLVVDTMLELIESGAIRLDAQDN